jgi:RimJ/RimL family protein N-acetyltransferase
MATETITFRPMTRGDLPLMCDWLGREHVRRWWRDARTPEAVEAAYGAAIDGTEPTRMFVIEIGGRAAGSIQTYLVSDYPEWIGDEPGVAGVDLFIGEQGMTGRGLGPRILTEFLRTVVFADPDTTACVAAPEAGNAASLRAFEKAGFRPLREIEGDNGPELLLRAKRENVTP